MREFSKIFKALSDPSRLRILKMLEARPLCVCEMQAILNLAPSTVSKHLSILRDAGFIFDEKENKWVNYCLDSNSQHQVIRDLLPLLQKWMPHEGQVLADFERANTVDRNTLCKA